MRQHSAGDPCPVGPFPHPAEARCLRPAQPPAVTLAYLASCAHEPTHDGTACRFCGLGAQPVHPDELTLALALELAARDLIEPEPGADADDRGSITAGEPGALWIVDPNDDTTEYPGGGHVATLHAEPLDVGPESTTVAWLAVTVSTDGPERVRAVIELGADAARALADLLYAAVRLADEADDR